LAREEIALVPVQAAHLPQLEPDEVG